ncbi:sigma-Y antisigma factor component [Cytobacillus purgationiresistens]|uniref:Cobalt transporter CbtA n=1 Tax=Cytobacillus purgationiresistens TaxID=863449 RepID=A0ABU0ACK4_9BACI|nr:sigma-Y antisigma factor component [Cytobacillus purgationiresistens]MDQ0268977.1 putative cobalt transporter CbtA [Cytobacillus purgationiresistens]
MIDENVTFVIITVGFILICQSLFLFMDARKHGHNYWLWGIIGLIQAPMPTLFYLTFVRKLWMKKEKRN